MSCQLKFVSTYPVPSRDLVQISGVTGIAHTHFDSKVRVVKYLSFDRSDLQVSAKNEPLSGADLNMKNGSIHRYCLNFHRNISGENLD